MITVADELASNAIQHTRSGRGGQFTVSVTWYGQIVRVAVTDGGAPDGPQFIDDPDAEHGRGLLVVRGLSVHSGARGDSQGRLVWADVSWDSTSITATPDPSATDAAEAAIRDGEAALARCFTSTPAWFGRATLAWWALAGPAELISAPTARELTKLLSRPDRPNGRAQAPASIDCHSKGEDLT